MSLDVYLTGETTTTTCHCPTCLTPHEREDAALYYSRNITHNLNKMADAAGLYMVLWRPDEAGIEVADDLIEPLDTGLERLRADPERFRQYNPENGWGDYEGLVDFVAEYLAACRTNPEAKVSASR